jgi:hypothetical protein
MLGENLAAILPEGWNLFPGENDSEWRIEAGPRQRAPGRCKWGFEDSRLRNWLGPTLNSPAMFCCTQLASLFGFRGRLGLGICALWRADRAAIGNAVA